VHHHGLRESFALAKAGWTVVKPVSGSVSHLGLFRMIARCLETLDFVYEAQLTPLNDEVYFAILADGAQQLIDARNLLDGQKLQPKIIGLVGQRRL
jgi:hypothetical protein